MDIINDIREQYNSLTRTQKRIADYILEYTDTALFPDAKGLVPHYRRVRGDDSQLLLPVCLPKLFGNEAGASTVYQGLDLPQREAEAGKQPDDAG